MLTVRHRLCAWGPTANEAHIPAGTRAGAAIGLEWFFGAVRHLGAHRSEAVRPEGLQSVALRPETGLEIVASPLGV